jgi:hypothetical protein
MSIKKVKVCIDNRVRLMSAMLSVTQWPDNEQERKPHGTHAHARGTRRFLKDYADHPAVLIVKTLIEHGAPLEAMYTYVTLLSWPDLQADELPPWGPPHWNDAMHDFYTSSGLANWWEEEDYEWESARLESQEVIEKASFAEFLEPFVGTVREDMLFMPNICYPTDIELGIRTRNNELICIAPPRIAWGDNPPWPFNEDPAHVYRAALTQYGRLCMLAYLRRNASALQSVTEKPLPVGERFIQSHPTWNEQLAALFVIGAVALFLESAIGKQEAMAYIIMQKKAEGVTILPGVVSVLRRYLSEYESGRYNSLVEYLPSFPQALRVAKSITSL